MSSQDSKIDLVAELLGRMAKAIPKDDLSILREVITDAWNSKVLHNLAAEPNFQKHFASLTLCSARYSDEQTLLALAELGRLPKPTRSERGWARKLAKQLIEARMPISFRVGDSDQRYYAAMAIQESEIQLDAGILARAAVEEDKGEKARRIWIRALLKRNPLPEVFEHIGKAISKITDSSADSRCHRLQRILKAVNDQFSQNEIPVDGDLCSSLKYFIDKSFFGSPAPRDYKISALAVEELLNTAIALIRFKFRLGAEPNFYAAISSASKWLPDGGWTRLSATSTNLKKLRQILLDGLLLLLEQGKPDDQLIKAHRALSSNQRAAQKELHKAEKSARNLPPDMRYWLASGGTKAPKTKAFELNETDDLSIAMAMIVADSLSHRTNSDVDVMLDDLRFKAPIHAETVAGLFSLTKELIDRVRSIADRRHLQLFGSPGEIVDFSPHAYRLPEDAPLTRRVQIRSPGVERHGRSSSMVVVPALVDAVN